MDFVDRDRRGAVGGGDLAALPLLVAPFVGRQAVDDRGRGRTHLRLEGVGIGLGRHQIAVGPADLELVALADMGAGNEDLPHADLDTPAHRQAAAVPVVEVADDADAAGAGGPDGEGHAGDAIDLARVGAQLLVIAQMGAFGQQMNVQLAKHVAEAIGVLELLGRQRILGAQAVAEALLAIGQHRQEEAVLMDALGLARRLAGGAVDHPQPLGAGHEGADLHRAAGALLLHAEHGEGIAMVGPRDGVRRRAQGLGPMIGGTGVRAFGDAGLRLVLAGIRRHVARHWPSALLRGGPIVFMDHNRSIPVIPAKAGIQAYALNPVLGSPGFPPSLE